MVAAKRPGFGSLSERIYDTNLKNNLLAGEVGIWRFSKLGLDFLPHRLSFLSQNVN
jgi:hypothetical protein